MGIVWLKVIAEPGLRPMVIAMGPVAVVAIACGSGDQPVATATPSPTATPAPTPQPPPAGTPALRSPTPTPVNSREEAPELLNTFLRPQLVHRGFEVAEIPAEIARGSTDMSVEQHEAIWTEFLTNTRVEFNSVGSEVLLCEGGRARAVRNARFFELIDQPLTWEISRSPAARGTDVTLKRTPLDPDLAANRLFSTTYSTPSYTVSVDYQQGFARFLIDATDAPETISPTETTIVRDPECSSHLPG